MNRLLLLGLNHTTAPLEVRERIAFNGEQQRAAVDAFRKRFPDCELVLLSTCNRVELYAGREAPAAGEHRPGVGEMAEFLADFHNVPVGAFREHLYHKAGRDAAEHLFRVACSLDSMVLGETQILGQVRGAYDAARGQGAAGKLLHPLFQRAISVGKQVMHQTSLAVGRVSVASVAVDCASRIFEDFADKTVLSIGAGKMSALVLERFAALSPKRLLVCNRDPAKAATLADRFQGDAVTFERLADHLVAADVVISSTGAAHPIITRKAFEPLRKARRYRPIFLIDIAVPRDVEASLGELDNVYLYNLDDLQQVVQGTQSQRRGAVEAAGLIVARHVDEFAVWNRQRELGPVIDRLYKRYHQLAREELERTVGKLENLSADDRASLEDMTRRIVNKMLHNPITALRQSEGAHVGGTYLHAMERLFDLAEGADAAAGGEPSTSAMPADSIPEGVLPKVTNVQDGERDR